MRPYNVKYVIKQLTE